MTKKENNHQEDFNTSSDRKDGMEDFISFIPDQNLKMTKSKALLLSKMMKLKNIPLVIQLPRRELEFEPGCTAQEILEAYHQYATPPKPGANSAKPSTPN